MEVMSMEPNKKASIKYICLMCKVELTVADVRAGFAVCESCRGYYFPERRVYHWPYGESGPAIVIRCERRKPQRLAIIDAPELWISKAGNSDDT